MRRGAPPPLQPDTRCRRHDHAMWSDRKDTPSLYLSKCPALSCGRWKRTGENLLWSRPREQVPNPNSRSVRCARPHSKEGHGTDVLVTSMWRRDRLRTRRREGLDPSRATAKAVFDESGGSCAGAMWRCVDERRLRDDGDGGTLCGRPPLMVANPRRDFARATGKLAKTAPSAAALTLQTRSAPPRPVPDAEARAPRRGSAPNRHGRTQPPDASPIGP